MIEGRRGGWRERERRGGEREGGGREGRRKGEKIELTCIGTMLWASCPTCPTVGFITPRF